MYTNVNPHGGKFEKIVDAETRRAKNLIIASGYTSFDVLQRYKDHFYRIADNDGSAKLLLGMAFYEGLTSNKLNLLKEISSNLEEKGQGSGVYVTYSGKYHGKIYCFDDGRIKNIYIGSSNFSRSGLSENIECTALIKDGETKQKALDFLEFLLSSDNAVSILKADITVPGTTRYVERLSLKTLDDLPTYDPKSIDKSRYSHFDYPLSRIAEKEKSSLNVYFGKGRWSRATGRVKPRPWYEVELIANKKITQKPLYPKGEFLAYTDDGYIMQMHTTGDYYKNIRSKGKLTILGQWIKRKLQDSEALIPLTPVTRDTLDKYGKDTIKFYKIEDGKYYMEF
ncbi:restriction endonuclease PLD domain-containing protein [Patescibacteria group bacterium]